MAEFVIGDVVMLKSGGPWMTITGHVAGSMDRLEVAFFNLGGRGELEIAAFYPACLELGDNNAIEQADLARFRSMAGTQDN